MSDLSALHEELPLPAGWSAPELVRHRTRVGAVQIELAGLSATGPDGVVVTSAAGCIGEDPLDRAYYELVERTGILEARRDLDAVLVVRDHAGTELRRATAGSLLVSDAATPTFTPARSNGVALGPTWRQAAERASLELAERDQVLRSWYGATAPERLSSGELMPGDLGSSCVVEVYRLDGGNGAWVVGVVCWPRDDRRPVVIGYGARNGLIEAQHAARDECLQRLGFLWDEDLPEVEPQFSPTPDYHQDYYLWRGSHGTLRAWLSGDHLGAQSEVVPQATRAVEDVEFVDLTPDPLRGRVALAQALPRRELLLGFGSSHPTLGAVGAALRVHPIV